MAPEPVQYCSRPAVQLAQSRHESTMQPTPTRSPTAPLRHCGSHLGHHPGDLVPNDKGIAGLTPLAAHRVDVGMADPREVNVELDVAGPDFPSFNRGPGQRGWRMRRNRRQRYS